MTTSPRKRLESRLLALTDGGDRDKLGGIALKAGVGPREMANAITGRFVATGAYLRICAAIQMDPREPRIGQYKPAFPAPAEFLSEILALSFSLRRRINGHTIRQAAKACQLSPLSITRIEAGKECGIGVVLKACVYLDQCPFSFVAPTVSRETPSYVADAA